MLEELRTEQKEEQHKRRNGKEQQMYQTGSRYGSGKEACNRTSTVGHDRFVKEFGIEPCYSSSGCAQENHQRRDLSPGTLS
ncbi:hypothetical protein [Olsenella sp. AGMB03486]|uniref:hypothetical protein n=1 Tax=Olsenella sp. AGMB03486 TaxID=3230364 RepID=UPI0034A04BDE